MVRCKASSATELSLYCLKMFLFAATMFLCARYNFQICKGSPTGLPFLHAVITMHKYQYFFIGIIVRIAYCIFIFFSI